MSVALNRLPDDALSAELLRRRADIEELKNSFQSLGSRSVRTFRIFSEDSFDVQFTPPPVVGTLNVNQVDVEFIPDNMIFGGAMCFRLAVKMMDLSGGPFTSAFGVEVVRNVRSDGRQIWSVFHVSFGYPGDTARLKFYLSANGSGTFTANVIT